MTDESTIGSAARPLRLVIAAGGTGGHVFSAVAVIEALRARCPVEVLWIGGGELERDAAAQVGVPFRSIQVGKLRRYLSVRTLTDALRIPIGVTQSWRLLKRFRPAVVLSTGGYVSVPTVIAARRLAIPAVTHEQTAYVGLATRINARFASVVALSYAQSRSSVKDYASRVVVTGNPVRAMVQGGDPRRARMAFNLRGDQPLVYVTGGAQGSRAINAAVAAALDGLLDHVVIVHQCGPFSTQPEAVDLAVRARALPIDWRDRYRVVERVGAELGDLYSAATLVVGRAGAGTIAELAAVGLPSILIPLPGATEQRQNASVLVDAGAAVLLPQEQLTPDRLATEIVGLVADPARLENMGAAARSVAADRPADRLAGVILELAQCRSR